MIDIEDIAELSDLEFASELIPELLNALDFNEKDLKKAFNFVQKNEEENGWEELCFISLGDAVAQSRPQFRTYQAKGTGKKGVLAYDPSNVRNFKKQLREEAERKLPNVFVPAAGQVRIIAKVFKNPPLSLSKVKYKAILAEMGYLRPEKTPDTDNYGKAIKDAFKGILWVDDNLIVDDYVEKYYSSKPRIEISIEYRQNKMDK
jgi:Holliday junction resolvase RusA-like endonuclease